MDLESIKFGPSDYLAMIKKYQFYILALFFISLSFGWLWRGEIRDWWWQISQPKLPEPIQAVETRGSASEEVRSKKKEISSNDKSTNADNDNSLSSTFSESEPIEIPSEINLAVPFTSQAPFASWDAFDEEMCEEAALAMVNRFYQNRQFLSKDDAQNALKEIKNWEEKNLSDWKSNDAGEVARIAREFLNYQKARVVDLINFQQIKEQLAQQNPVILPAAGRELKNPNFKQPGPLYHMLVVRGWFADGRIITNDPGTRRGESYIYDQQILWNAIHDWNAGDVDNGKKVMIVIQ